jgi:hypothetical protein
LEDEVNTLAPEDTVKTGIDLFPEAWVGVFWLDSSGLLQLHLLTGGAVEKQRVVQHHILTMLMIITKDIVPAVADIAIRLFIPVIYRS